MALSPVRASDSLADQIVIRQLQARDTVVRAHEAAHIAAGGGTITSGASYAYQRGPDGREYAVGGEVGIDASPVPGNPKATMAKMAIVRAAALAPAQPSAQDQAVAASASLAEAQARAQAYQKKPQQTGTIIDLTA
jgi:hypothetical protein